MSPQDFLPTIEKDIETVSELTKNRKTVEKKKEDSLDSLNPLLTYLITTKDNKEFIIKAHNYYLSNGFVVIVNRKIIPKTNEIMQTAIFSIRLEEIFKVDLIENI